ncbi:MAG: aldo/keto reductase, partial [Candidatus Poribacteria bacterium]|nr:aldo/keto reductase [Candidatus Poribacteria bacterium]
LRFTLSQPITAAIPPGDESLYRLALDIAQNLPAEGPALSKEEHGELEALAATLSPIFHKETA